MEKESFENEDTAKLMNEFYVNIKVDREERPDLDSIFQKSLSILTGAQGGWPLSMFLDENGVPFTGGTYFPPKEMQNRPSFSQVIMNVSKVYNELIVQYSGENFLRYANVEAGATLPSDLNQKAAFEGFESGDLQFTRFLNSNTNSHVFTSESLEIEELRLNADFVEAGNAFRLFQTEVDGTQAVHRFFNTETGFHHYSTDINEIENFEASSSYSSEGIVGYGGVVDAREAEQVASQQSTINVSNRFDKL